MAKAKTKSTTKKSTKTTSKKVVATPVVAEATVTEPVPEPAVAETVATEKTYNFNTVCKSGETKSVTIIATSLSDARNQLREFAEKN